MAASCLVGVVTLGACQANPGPPPVVEAKQMQSTEASSSATSTKRAPQEEVEEPATKRSTVSVGVDPLRGGLNPHLVANNSELVSQIAELVLPSAFHGEEMDTDVLESAEEVEAPSSVAMRVRYTIASPAQWSDGTPISGSDFFYLWDKMTTTPGVNDPAGYNAISSVRTTGNGRVVTVDFSRRVADWHQLFAHLVPSHLLQDVPFTSALADGIPASAGRYLVRSVDRGRNVITLNRNDRFWGQDPALIDVVQLRGIRDTNQAVNMLRSRQVGFVDFTPEQTSLEYLGLLSNVNAGTVTRPRQLRLHLSTYEGALPEREQRRGLASLIDTAQIARLATGRASELRPGDNPVAGEAGLAPLRERAGAKPLRIGVDPTNPTALAAANAIVDVLRAQAIDAELVTERLTTITSDLLPHGEIDAVVTWEDTTVDAISIANHYVCASSSRYAGDVSGFCPEDAAATRDKILSGQTPVEEALHGLDALNREEVLYVPVLDETRIHALGQGIVGPGQRIEDWDSGLVSAPMWKIDEE